jgi:hypothetical protein
VPSLRRDKLLKHSPQAPINRRIIYNGSLSLHEDSFDHLKVEATRNFPSGSALGNSDYCVYLPMRRTRSFISCLYPKCCY